MPLFDAHNKVEPIQAISTSERAVMESKGGGINRRRSIEEELAAAKPHEQIIPSPKSGADSDSDSEEEDEFHVPGTPRSKLVNMVQQPLEVAMDARALGAGDALGASSDLKVITKGSNQNKEDAVKRASEERLAEPVHDSEGDGYGEAGNTSSVLGRSRWNRWFSVKDDEGAFIDLRKSYMIHPHATSVSVWNYVIIVAVAITRFESLQCWHTGVAALAPHLQHSSHYVQHLQHMHPPPPWNLTPPPTSPLHPA